MRERPFAVVDCAQRTPEWYRARLGRLTGSCADSMLAMLAKGGEKKERANLRATLVAERLTGHSQDEDVFVTREMQRGIALESAAFDAYEIIRGEVVHRSGFIYRPDLLVGASVDGYIGDYDGIVELKCPKSTTHINYVRGGVVPTEYLPQILHGLWVSGAAWCDFVSFDDRLPEKAQFFCRRVERSAIEKELQTYDTAARKFLDEVDAELAEVETFMKAVA